MKLELRVAHECNRLVSPRGALGYSDTKFNRLGILNMLNRLKLVDDSTSEQIEKAIDLTSLENPEITKKKLLSFLTILDDVDVEEVIEIDCVERKGLSKRVEREVNRLLLSPPLSLGSGDTAFVRAMFLSVLDRLELIDHADFLTFRDAVGKMKFIGAKVPPLLASSILEGLPEESNTLLETGKG